MARIIKNRAIVEDGWHVLRLNEGESAESVALPDGPVIVPFEVWQARGATLKARGNFGVWLDSHQGPELIADDLAHFALIALNYPKFTDGRAYSSARLLRERYQYRGELRAIGDVLHDQLFFMHRVGFDAFALKADKDIEKALQQAFSVFSDAYQTAVDVNLPHYRRRVA